MKHLEILILVFRPHFLVCCDHPNLEHTAIRCVQERDSHRPSNAHMKLPTFLHIPIPVAPTEEAPETMKQSAY